MLYRIGTTAELPTMETQLPATIYAALCIDISFLDSEYGSDRNYLQTGGYAVILGTTEDLLECRRIIDYERHPCEWVRAVGQEPTYIIASYVLNNDFSVTLYLPRTITPNTILNELED